MKVIVALVCAIGLMSSYADSGAQVSKLNFQIKKGTVKDVLETIEEQTGLSFMYDNALFDVNRSISLSVDNESVEKVLEKLLVSENLKYEKVNRYIVITASDPVQVKQQQKSISGKVTDSSGAPLPGVTIVIKGTTTGIITGFDGNFSLSNIPSDATLVFSFVGMKTVEFAASGKSVINVKMEDAAIDIDEVVAIGYGTMKKKDLSGSVASVQGEQIKNIPVTTVEQALIGHASGVQVVQDGAPGGGATVRIRGISTTGNNDPLWVVDGLAMGGVYNLNPGDIETIDILKDASATAIYGSRAANGVIIATTKHGKEGKTKVEFDSFYGFQQASKQLDVLNGPEFAALANEAYTNSSLPLNPAWANPASLPTTNWQDAIFQNGAIQNYNLNISGGSQKLKAALSLNYYNTEGSVITSKFERYSVRLNADYEVSKRLRFGSNLQFSRNSKKGISGMGTSAWYNKRCCYVSARPACL